MERTSVVSRARAPFFRNKADKSVSNFLNPSILEGLAPLPAPMCSCIASYHSTSAHPRGAFLFYRKLINQNLHKFQLFFSVKPESPAVSY